MLKQRVLTALALLPPLVAALVLLPAGQIHWLLAPILGLAMWEWARLSGWSSAVIRIAAGTAMAIALVVLLPRQSELFGHPMIAIAAAVLWLFVAGWLTQPTWGRTGRLAPLTKFLFGWLVIGFAGVALFAIFQFEDGRVWLFCLLLFIWGADCGAYFTGKAFGKRKLAPRISPGKTWEGVYGGLATVILVAIALSFFLPRSALALAGIGVVCAIVSIVGDLFASLLKRQADLKDSSHLLPGHGGVIDRLDSLFAAAPIFYGGVALTA